MKKIILVVVLSLPLGIFAQKTLVTIAGEKVSYPANAIATPNTPAGGISATNVQGALNEMDTEKADKTNGAAQITDANSATYTNIGILAAAATQATINLAIDTKFATMPSNGALVHIAGAETITGIKTFS